MKPVETRRGHDESRPGEIVATIEMHNA